MPRRFLCGCTHEVVAAANLQMITAAEANTATYHTVYCRQGKDWPLPPSPMFVGTCQTPVLIKGGYQSIRVST